MTEDAQAGAPNIYPGLVYADVSAAIGFLERAFGFVPTEVVKGADDEVIHAELRFGAGTVMVEPGTEGNEYNMYSPRKFGGVSHVVCVYVEDLDAHYERARAAGAEIVTELAETNYGTRSYLARDLEGHLWTFGTYRPSAGSGH